MKYIEVEYNRKLKEFETILADVKQPGDFYAAGTIEIPMPRIEVDGAGLLSFPIPPAQIEAMRQHATQAPFGRGEETVVDRNVRNVWQIAPSAVQIDGKSWAANFESILSKVTAGLGCQDATVSAEFYKLLIYARGGFFLAHRDTEKSPGMFGTLVLTLPSNYRGGALRIRHADREVTVETFASDPSDISFAAFYADCEHEALPVEKGNRVCLVYNLLQTPTKSKHRVLKAPDHGAEVAKAAAVLDKYFRSPNAPSKIAWLLDHQYSPAGLSFSSLKGADAAKANVLFQAAAQARCAAHLAVVHIGEIGAADPDGDFYYSSRRRRYSGPDEDDMDFTAFTVDDTWKYLDEWSDTADREAGFGRIPLADGELLPAGALDKEPPDDKRLTEATGNEGASYERSYHRAALVLWPSDRTVDILLQAGVVATLPYLKRLITDGAEALAVAKRIVDAWRDRTNTGDRPPKSTDRAAMIALLVRLREPELLSQFIHGAVIPAYDGAENAALLSSVARLGEPRAAAVFSALMEAGMPNKPGACAELLHGLTAKLSRSFRLVADAAVAGLDGIKSANSMTPEFLENLFAGLRSCVDESLSAAAAEKIAARPEIFDPTALVVPAIERIGAGQHTLWTSTAEYLLRRGETPPQPPGDWRLKVQISCSCADCRELLAFARDPAARVHRFRVNLARRRHLHETIDRRRLDMVHLTERVSSPQTLVCTKDRRTYNARRKEYDGEIDAMRKLVQIAQGSDALRQRLEAAIEASAL